MDAHPPPNTRAWTLPVTPAQIVALGLVAASIGWAAWILRDRPAVDEVALLEDTVLTASQLAGVEAALDRAGLTEYRTSAGRVWVPRARQSAYKRAVVDGDALPKPWGTRFHDAIASGSPWASPTARAESLKVALQDELALVLGSMPGIERAAVLIDEEPQVGFRHEPLKTASVGIRTTPGTELDAVRAQGIRVLVSASIAGLEPERVAVTDLVSGRVYTGPLPAAATGTDSAAARRSADEDALAGRVQRALGFVSGVKVDVAIALVAAAAPAPEPSPPLDRAVAAANAPAEVLPEAPVADLRPAAPTRPAMAPRPADGPRDIRITVAVPDSYLAAAVAAGGARRAAGRPGGDVAEEAEEAEHAETERLREIVLRALGGVAANDTLGVLVTAYPARAGPVGRCDEDVAPARSASAAAETADTAAAVPRLPREVWLALASVAVGLLAGFLWWVGGRDRGGAADEEWHGGHEGGTAAARPRGRVAA